MTKTSTTAAKARPEAPSKSTRQSPADIQPRATGANRGSPATSVMKQFAKTKAESSGRS
jgi:hypothetical protein